jgi:DNA-directed RNA polymerase subunit RPC12/RpoP
MMQLKACRRCAGDMITEEILGEVELVCIQCGHRTPLPAREPLLAR